MPGTRLPGGFFSQIDVYRQARFINYGMTDPYVDRDTRFRAPSGDVAVALFAIGLYGLVRQLFDFDLGFLAEQWYLFVMAFGGWMIYQGIQARRAQAGLDSANL